jgi:hypothetical protein
MRSRDPSINVTYGIMTMIYLFCVGIVNTLQIRIYQEKKVIPYRMKPKKKTPKVVKESFGNVDEIETTTKETAAVDENALTLTEIILMTISIPLAFGFIIGFDCSCPPDDDHVSKIIFCLGVFIPIIYIIVSEIIALLFPDNDYLNPFLSSKSSKKEIDTHFFNIQYRKTLCWSIITLSFIIHFFSVAFRQTSGGGSVGII